MSSKQEIYRELLRISIVTIRNITERWFVLGMRRGEAYQLSQLIHDLHGSLFTEDFVDHDFYFLNVHAKYYYENAIGTSMYNQVVSLLFELVNMVPNEQRGRLKWTKLIENKK